jgi:L-amino acid N-acyltransferase YncA
MRTVSPQLRRASAEDSESILAIYNESIRRGEISCHDHELTIGELPELLPPGDRCYGCVATIAGVIRGWAASRSWHQRAGYAPTLELLVYVAVTHRSHGLAKALVSQVIASASHAGYRSILALALADDIIATRLSRSTNFFIAGTLSGTFPGTERPQNVTLYQRFFDNEGI